jgi:hypothetical protein
MGNYLIYIHLVCRCNRSTSYFELLRYLLKIGVQNHYLEFDHFLIHCNRLITDITNSCPLEVSLYSTRGGISLYASLSNIPPSSSSFNRRANVLLLKPFSNFLNSLYLTGIVEQQSGINISIVPLLVINLRILAVSFISIPALYPSKLHSLCMGSRFTPCPFVSDMAPCLLRYPS